MNETTTERARACYIVHQGACEHWTHGKPVDIWRDENHGRAELDAAGFIRAEENDKRTHIKNS